MASKVEIVNLALRKLGAGRITALTDGVEPARVMNDIYDMVRRAELRRSTWGFALRRDSLPALAAAPEWGFARAFALPADFLRLVQVGDIFAVPAQDNYVNSDNSLWAIESNADGVRVLLTDLAAPLKIRYVRDVTDETQFDALFCMALAARLAYEGCEQITGSNTKKDAAAGDYTDAMKQAVRTNAVERPPVSIADDSWLVGRL